MYILKQLPEDFFVKEKSTIQPESSGRFTYFLLKKKDYNTIRALQRIADKLKMPLKRLGFAGNKDKIAITEQVCSVDGIGKKIEAIKIPNIGLKYLGQGSKPVSLGDLEGNYFEIIVRNIVKAPKPINSFINYFGEQRFSSSNIKIGKALLKRDFEKACILIDDSSVKEYLKSSPTNFIGALRRLPKKLLRLYISSYQSFLWNETVKELIKMNVKLPKAVPILGFGTEIEDKMLVKVIEILMKKEKIVFRDFIIKEFPELSSEGGSRAVITSVRDLVIGELKSDELNPKMKKCRISFFLDKGCYATEFIRQLFV